ncbi:unnamed protein product [Mytilus coruscus]|uniref:DDE Tnp4 domain-containing protein n=1 Tax=Mytilus coruscus TaxID=42192 RepID=A0A6J8E4H8_MYTCO|nr:unnamed protein product [Mytilus coruscus]
MAYGFVPQLFQMLCTCPSLTFSSLSRAKVDLEKKIGSTPYTDWTRKRSTRGGLVKYVANAYGGCTNDRQIVERCKIVQLCDPGDSVMADKGFNVQDLFAIMDAAVNIPIFFEKRNRISRKTLLRDRKVSSKRVHIERIIGLGKTYKILTNPMNGTETKLASDITFSCFMLFYFRTCIVPKDA